MLNLTTKYCFEISLFSIFVHFVLAPQTPHDNYVK